MSYDNETIVEPKCPICHGKMWDNRETKKNPKAPDFKCRDKQCEGVIWPPKNGAPAPVAKPKPLTTAGEKQPYSSGPALPYESETGAPPAASPTNVVAGLDKLFGIYSLIEDHVLATSAPKWERAKVGSSPESVAAQIATLFIAAKDAGLAR